ncbi:MAG: hypothetical protein IKY94_05630 [Lachnospiraceae bacterium]|nr:hypothetical protein [Lachnospiraceae bacterium]
MKKNLGQGIKYTAVVLAFVIMAGFFILGNKEQVNATEAGATVSGGNSSGEDGTMLVDDTTTMESWNITVVYCSDEEILEKEIAEGTPSSGATIIISPDVNPTKTDLFFAGWKYENIIYKANDFLNIQYSDKESIILEAQWKDTPDPVTVNYYVDGELKKEEVIDYKEENKDGFSIPVYEPEENPKGYNFDGWMYKDSKVEDKAIFSWYIYSGRTMDLEASFVEKKEIIVKIDTGDGGDIQRSIYTDEDIENGVFKIELPYDLEKKEFLFGGWSCSAPEECYTVTEENEYIFSWDKCNVEEINFIAQWWDGQVTESGKTYNLREGIPYTLGDGNWKVGDDGYSYSGGRDVFVRSSGSYTFTKN